MQRRTVTHATRDIQAHGSEIVLVDHEPLRRVAAADCSRATERLQRARQRWHRFEREDKPAFIRWRARRFGALLSRAREVEERIREAQALIHEVEMEMRRFFQDPQSAYRRVMFRKANPLSAPPENDDGSAETAGRRVSEFEQEALFQEWVRRSLGTNPDKMDDEAYTQSFHAFKQHMFRKPAEKIGPAPTSPETKEDSLEETPPPLDPRLKELYRILVRRLHPDLRADGNAAAGALWHDVQEAYAAADIARMQILLALSDISSDYMSASTSLAQMRAVLLEMERAARALEKSVLEAQGEDAWNFARAGENEDLRRRVERELKADLARRSGRLDELTRVIAAWQEQPSIAR